MVIRNTIKLTLTALAIMLICESSSSAGLRIDFFQRSKEKTTSTNSITLEKDVNHCH